MTRKEFAEGMIYLAAGIGKEPPDGAEMPYFDLLGHLVQDVFLQACRNVMATHKWFNFPTVAEMLEAVRDLQPSSAIMAGDAWRMAQDAIAQIDPDISGPHRVYRGNGEFTEYASQAEVVLSRLPEQVAKVIRTFGLHELAASDPVGVIRAQFSKVFEQSAERDKRMKAIQPVVRSAIERQRDEQRVKGVLAGIGEAVK